MDDRLVALSVAFDLYVAADRPSAWRDRLKAAVADHAELEPALRNRLQPPPQSAELRTHKESERRYVRRRKEREKKATEQAYKWRTWLDENTHLLRDVSVARTGSVWNVTVYLLEQLRNVEGAANRWAFGNWQDLIAKFGEGVARAFRDGAVAYWRSYTPKLRSEGIENPNSTPTAVIVGLSGLEIDARETPNWAAKLSQAEVGLAFRYAMLEMNGFPNWLPELYRHHPTLVKDALLREIAWEFENATAENWFGYVVSDLQYHGAWIKDELASDLLWLLANTSPANEQVFLSALTMIVNCDQINEQKLAQLAQTRCNDEGRPQHLAIWLAVWASVDPDPALSALEAHALTIVDQEQAKHFVMKFAVSLMAERQRHGLINKREAYRTPQHLLRLHTILHTYIQRADDLHRVGNGVFSPTLRDDAQDARNRVFSLLKEIPGKEGYLALRAIAAATPDTQTRRWMDYHAETRAAADADLSLQSWSTSNVLSFASERERKPQSHRELFNLSVYRLNDLKYDLEDGDGSIASLLILSDQETEHRKNVGNWLRQQCRGRYVVPQEEELADAKRVDIRIHTTGFDGPVPIELKIADNWTGPKLFERLENQLIGDYLRDQRSNCGIYLLLDRGTKSNWEHPSTEERLDFGTLVKALQVKADALIENNPGIDTVAVLGIDLTKRGRQASK